MAVTPDQARDSLNEIREMTAKLRRSLAASEASGHLMLWGAVWMGAFLACGLWPHRSGLIWGIGNAVGVVGSITIGLLVSNTKVHSDESSHESRRLLLMWLSMFVFVGVWLWLLRPESGEQIAAFICTAVMFLYIVMGLWLEAGFLAWLGVAVTALTIAGYQWFPGQFYFWMAFTGGGSLFASGLYIHKAWK